VAAVAGPRCRRRSRRGDTGSSEQAAADEAEGGSDERTSEDIGRVMGTEVKPADPHQRCTGEQQGIAPTIAALAHHRGGTERR